MQRNRVKRRIREWFRRARREIAEREGEAVDVVVIARRGAPVLGGAEVQDELDGALGIGGRER